MITEEKKAQSNHKYAINKEFRKGCTTKLRETYKSDESFKLAHATKMKEKYQTNESYKEALSSQMRKKYHNEETRSESKLKRKREYQEEYNTIKRCHNKSKTGLHIKFYEQKREMPTTVCTCCAQLFFKKSTISETNLKLKSNLNINKICTYRIHLTADEIVTCLPRMDSEDDTLLIQLMRRMSDKKPYAFENVRPEKNQIQKTSWKHKI
ncbi:LOW QUALITY PROTEIN: Acyl-[acyl-carrier-protein]--UDP-N-acetylglucosamine O-acyltransferase [Frankliniella fusca]|uniref:Acyl-[acyl-carrier-protein]--UDP-N-acetylglucosamine O-acyltransferase n=1 Tax=Frankliniella fusca TaxID=407009 RepID=A0AAE1GVQ9_9NEOP|nr:LOW QUALITY PROTEIN: Acyl-[acyl-carrier-protein]--UDP-N-acetylglucosamine O-acyltransferase [Frankliniella fusca]